MDLICKLLVRRTSTSTSTMYVQASTALKKGIKLCSIKQLFQFWYSSEKEKYISTSKAQQLVISHRAPIFCTYVTKRAD